MSTKIEYSYRELLGPHEVPFLEELEKHYYPSGGSVRQALFECPVCQENTFKAFIKDVKAGKTWRCKECKKKATAQRFGKDLTNQRFGNLVVLKEGERDDINQKRRWVCVCDCGEQILKTGNELVRGKARSCGKAKCIYHQEYLAKMNMQDLTEQKFGKLTVKKLYKLVSSEGPLWECDCECGNKNCIFPSRSLLANGRQSCGCTLSKGEAKLQNIFDTNNIKYEKEKTYSDCINPKTNRKLRFDFYLPDYDIIIEYDGIQHFQEPKNSLWNSLEYVQQMDNIKNEYCFNNNLKIIRIPYTDYDKINLNYILDRIKDD